MPSREFDPRPRDDVYPSSDELRRAMIPQQLNPEELIGPDYPLPEHDATTRAKMPTVSWPSADRDSPDYAHLEPQGREPIVGDKKFKISGDDIERLLAANVFQPKGPDGRYVIAFRGANLIDDEDDDNDGIVDGVDHIKLEETRPDHEHFRCVIGYYHPGTKTFSAFRSSTVPHVSYMTNYYQFSNGLGGDRSKGAANMLPTGCYVFRVGSHSGGKIYPALRLTDAVDFSADGAATVLRTKNDLTFKTDDIYENTVTQDHVHCAYSDEMFYSAGCLTVRGKNGEGGPWSHFQGILKRFKNNTRIDVVLLTGRDASIAAYLGTTGRAADSDYAERLLQRLRPGSTGDAVSRLQEKLGQKPSGYFGPGTKLALVEFQRKNNLTVDGIWSPALDDALGWGILKPAVATPAQQPAPAMQPAPAPQPAPVAAAAPAPLAPAAPPKPVQVAAPVATAPPAPAPAAKPPAPAPPAPAAQVASATPPAPATVSSPASVLEQAPVSAEAPAVLSPNDTAAADSRGRTPASPMSQFNSVRTVAAPVIGAAATAGAAAAAAVLPPTRPVSPGLGAVAQRTSPTPAAPPSSPPVGARSPAPIPAPAPQPIPVKPAAMPPTSAQPAAIQQPAPVQQASPQAAPAQAAGSQSSPLKLLITRETLVAFAPHAVPQYAQALLGGNDVLTRYALNLTPLRLCHFLGQIGNECGRLTILEENLAYRSAARIREVWPTRFPTLAAAQPYVNEPMKLADKVYGGRFDNGPGDGWRYRGRGLVQITGRANYREMGKRLGIPLEEHPELALDPRYALAVACETWANKQMPGERDMNKLADANKLEALTYRINGGYTNIADRRAAFEHAWEVWASGDAPTRMLDPDTLDRGDRGGRVDELNALLRDFGLFVGITHEPPQHVFSNCTYRAVRVLQAESGMPETGIAGPETWSALDKAVHGGLTTRGRGTATEEDATGNVRRNPLARRLAEIRFWSIALSIIALLYIVTHIFMRTHPSGVIQWLPMLFAAAVFIAGMALWLAARPQPQWHVPHARGVTHTKPRRGPAAFYAGEEEPVRLGINM